MNPAAASFAPFNLTGRRALVTGSSRGIGAAIATALAGAGADVVIHSTGNGEQAREISARIAAGGRRTGVVQADLAADDGARLAYEGAVAALGGIDILVLNASVQTRKSWLEFTRADVDRQVAVNYRSSLELLQLAAPGMMAGKWGRIVTLGSVQEVKPHPEMLVYSSLKHAQTGLALGLARQLAPHGVTINNLAPGVIQTDRNTAALADAAYAEKVRAAIPAGFFGESADCAGAALLLCSDAGRYITGQNLFIDGGLGL
ncbi:MAG: short-chain dehydrogenase [Rariglobus sp.]|jgi:NAD(P)-dependent dehydrogenase (short-subunit alcohol dehydrogenase family)|nr:short-chain dehydrogenase [Rariglobus sp.]